MIDTLHPSVLISPKNLRSTVLVQIPSTTIKNRLLLRTFIQTAVINGLTIYVENQQTLWNIKIYCSNRGVLNMGSVQKLIQIFNAQH